MGKDLDDNSQATKTYQLQTISNLYNSGIPSEIISFQLDITEEVEKTIEKIKEEQEPPKATASLDLFYLDAVVNVDMAIKQAQNSMWKALKSELTFDISMEETHEILEMYARSFFCNFAYRFSRFNQIINDTANRQTYNDNSSI